MWYIPPPRLLPATIATLAALLMLKVGILLEVVVTHGAKPESAMVTSAKAASTERAQEAAPEHPPAEHPTEHPAEHPAEHPPGRSKPAEVAPAPNAQKTATAAGAPEAPPPVTESERALLQDLRQRRKELDDRAETVATREAMLMAAEHKLTTRVGELQALQKKLEGLDAAQKQKEDAGWQGLVKLYESMKPKDAATIFNDLQMPVLLQVLDRMKDAKAAAVMAAMNPEKARDVTSELAQLRTGKTAAQLSPGAPTNPAGS